MLDTGPEELLWATLNERSVNRCDDLALPDVACHSVCMDTGDLGRAIRLKRKAQRMSIEKLAQRLGMVPRTLGAWERGENNGAWDHIPELEGILGPLQGLPDEEPSIPAVLAQLRTAAQALDIAREMLHAIEPPVG